MHARSLLLAACVTACTVLPPVGRPVVAAELSVTIQNPDGRGVSGAVVIAEPAVPAPRARTAARASMDQRELQFRPEVLVVRTGTAVDFPNSDQVRHQVYSFSGAKTFQLALYAGRAHPPVVFDKAGLVTLGCNIHDGMIGYIYVTDSPWFGQTDDQGRLQLDGLPAGSYTLRIWHPRLSDAATRLDRQLNLQAEQKSAIDIRLTRALRAPTHTHGSDKRWEDY